MADTSALSLVVRQAGGSLLPADPKGRYLHRFEIRSSSIDKRTGMGRLYVVSFDTATRQWCCSCPGWITRRNCKHLTAMAPGLARIGADKAATPTLPQIKGASPS